MRGGGPLVLGLLVAAACCAFGWVRRSELGVVLLVGFAPALAWLVVAAYVG
jgi:hypothetical protein